MDLGLDIGVRRRERPTRRSPRRGLPDLPGAPKVCRSALGSKFVVLRDSVPLGLLIGKCSMHVEHDRGRYGGPCTDRQDRHLPCEC